MNTDDENGRPKSGQASLRFDDAPARFRSGKEEDHFSGASGVLFEQAMAQTRMAICLVDPHEEDLPIVFANRAFRRLTGYSEEEIVGNNCRFLQGPKTDPQAVGRLRDAIKNEDVVVVELLNYRKNGTTFWNALHVGPIYNDAGELVYFFGSQWDVSDVRAARAEEQHAREMSRELSHRMKNMFAVIAGIVNVTGRARGIQDDTAEISARIQALGRAYETTLDERATGDIDIGEAIRAVMSPYERFEGQLELVGNGARTSFTVLSAVGLVLHELCANAIKYGAWASDGGKVRLSWDIDESNDHLVLDWQESGVPADVDALPSTPGSGTVIVDRLLASSGGLIQRDWTAEGLHAKVSIPTRRKS